MNCRDCDKELTEDQVSLYYNQNEPICENCADSYNVCVRCARVLADSDDSILCDDKVYCQSCADRVLTCCQNCQDYFNPECEGLRDICGCCSEHYFVCDSCDELLHNDHYGNNGLCENCYHDQEEEDQESEFVHGYHEGANPGTVFHGELDTTLYFGVELETDNYRSDLNDTAEALYELSDSEKLFHMEEDCSLSKGIEIITQPCSLDFHRDRFPWKEIIATVKQHGGKSENTERAAIHVHFSKAFFLPRIRSLCDLKLIYLTEKFWDNLVLFARTSEYLLGRSCLRYERRAVELLGRRPASETITRLHSLSNRYWAVNLHSGKPTIEIRLFRGTLRISDILASLELVDLLARLARHKKIAYLRRLDWQGFVKLAGSKRYRYLSQGLAKYVGEGKPCNQPRESESLTQESEAEQSNEPSITWVTAHLVLPTTELISRGETSQPTS